MALLASLHCAGEVHLVVGSSGIAAQRVGAILEAGARPVLVDQADLASLPRSLQAQIEAGLVTWIPESFHEQHLQLGRPEVLHIVDKVFVTLPHSEHLLKQAISAKCRALRIPVNVTDCPELCTFTLLATHTDGPFQLGVLTSGKGCKLAARLKRELVLSLPGNIRQICEHVGELRARLKESDGETGAHDDDAVTTSLINALVPEFGQLRAQQQAQRARFLAQVVEYYPLLQLADVDLDDMVEVHRAELANGHVAQKGKGQIALVGAGPGLVELLTIGALQAIHSADLILADKLVPEQVLNVINRKTTRVFIARKFPGNAERAQQELLAMGLEALQKGEAVVRLKQGDPYIFGRGGEEYLFFQSHGYTPRVLPGITLALAAPVLSHIPATHRDVADQVLICTGTGRRGALPNLPDYVESRTTVFLMALHRIVELVPHMIARGWLADLPVAIVERALCPDQRVVRTTLGQTPAAVEALGLRPPGLFIAGKACEVLALAPLAGGLPWTVEEGNANAAAPGLVEKLVGQTVDA